MHTLTDVQLNNCVHSVASMLMKVGQCNGLLDSCRGETPYQSPGTHAHTHKLHEQMHGHGWNDPLFWFDCFSSQPFFFFPFCSHSPPVSMSLLLITVASFPDQHMVAVMPTSSQSLCPLAFLQPSFIWNVAGTSLPSSHMRCEPDICSSSEWFCAVWYYIIKCKTSPMPWDGVRLW